MKKEALFFVCWLLVLMLTSCQVKEGNLQDQKESPVTIVILGSSTAAGTGPKDIANAWVNRYIAYVEDSNHDRKVINLAKGSYTTYHILPRDYVPPEGRPRPDPGRCITMALLLEASAIIINLPSNDAAYGYSVTEQLANYDSILTAADAENVPIWITTTQPRNLSVEKRQNLMDMRDSTWSRFGSKAVDFWTRLAQEDGTIDPAFDCGDGVHLNDLGHSILFERVVAAGVLDSVLAYGN